MCPWLPALYCTDGDTPVLEADGRQTRIADLRVGDSIVGTEPVGVERRYVLTEVLAQPPADGSTSST